VRFQRWAHNPLLTVSGFDMANVVVPWLGRKQLHLAFGQPPQ
jgi:hypothetical protein